MTIANETVAELTRAMWGSVLGGNAERRPAERWSSPSPLVTSLVRIGGAWRGAVTLTCTVALARRVAESMLEVAPGQASIEDVRDAWGELANILGGNIKRFVPGPSQLTLPLVVVDGEGHDAAAMNEEPSDELWFDCDGELLRVRLYGTSEKQLYRDREGGKGEDSDRR